MWNLLEMEQNTGYCLVRACIFKSCTLLDVYSNRKRDVIPGCSCLLTFDCLHDEFFTYFFELLYLELEST